jgi:hypothetical protein
MEKFKFKVTQQATTYFIGEIEIEAKSEVEAIKKIKKMSQKKIEGISTDWEMADEGADAHGFIEVYDEKGNALNR